MIEIIKKSGLLYNIDEIFLKQIVRSFVLYLFSSEKSISILLTDDKEIQEYNFRELGKNYPTDILSWSYLDVEKDDELIGEIMISMDRVKNQSLKNGWNIYVELVRLLAHGCAHISGLDHEISHKEEQKMLFFEIQMLKEVGLKNIYGS